MINKDIVYIFCFVLILINYIINKYNYNIPICFKKNILLRLIFIICILYLAIINIYLGVFLGITFLSLN